MSAPDSSSLRKLKGMLPMVAHGLLTGGLTGKGRKVPVAKPRKTCKVCCALFDYTMVPDGEQWIIPESDFCDRCGKMIKDGNVALICGDRFAFVKSKALDDLEEKVITMEPHQMDDIQKHFKAEWNTANKP